MRYFFTEWGRLENRLKNKRIFLFLDFDGTLAPIAENPDKAVLSKSVKSFLLVLSRNPKIKLIFISGRGLEDIKRKIGINNAIYSGNHGLQISGPKIKFKSVIHPHFRKTLERIKEELVSSTSGFKGVFIEDKGLSLSIHYRQVNKKDIPRVKAIFYEAVIAPMIGNKLKIKPGKMVLEARPPVNWDKGKAVLWLLARQIFQVKNTEAIPIYIGDDSTDEDAFKALNKKGLTVFVGKPKKSFAQYYLKSTKEVKDLLKRMMTII